MSLAAAGDYWDEIYSRGRSDALSWYQAQPEPSLRLLLAAVPGARSAIDVGGGSSALAGTLVAADCPDVTVLDVSAKALAQLAETPEAAKVQTQVADVRTWIPERTRELWHDRAGFNLEASEEQIHRTPLGFEQSFTWAVLRRR